MKRLLIPFFISAVLFSCDKADRDESDIIDMLPGRDTMDVITGLDTSSIINGLDTSYVVTDPSEVTLVAGYAQKGQLIKGSQVTASALDSNLQDTGRSYRDQILDNMGAFIIKVASSSPYLELNAQGYYFVENIGEISSSPIYLQAIVPSSRETANLNLLTTLIAPRVKALVSGGMSLEDAEAQAQDEIMTALGYEEFAYQRFTDMNVDGTNISDAILLAVSLMSQEGRSTGEVQSLIADISSDLEKNGTISDMLKNQLFESADEVDVWDVTKGLMDFYAKKGIENYSIPPFYRILNEEYSSGIHFFADEPLNVVGPEYQMDCNVGSEGSTVSRVVLCIGDFEVESDCDWIKVEKEHIIADFYSVKYTIEPNTEGIRTGTVQYLINRSGNLSVEYEDVYKQMSGKPRLYVELPEAGGTKSLFVMPVMNPLEAGEKLSVNGVVYEVQSDDIGTYVDLKEKADYYRICYPIESTYKDEGGNEVSFVPVQCYGDDFYYSTVMFPPTGYPEGVFPFYGIIAHHGVVMKAELKPCYVALLIEIAGVEVIDNAITVVSDEAMFGSFTYSNYLTQDEINLNPDAPLVEPVVSGGINEVQLKLHGEGSLMSTSLLLIPVQNYNFSYFDRHIKKVDVSFDYSLDGERQSSELSLPMVDCWNTEGTFCTYKLSYMNGSWEITISV